MGRVEKKREFARPADVVWELIGDFHGLHRWNPGLEPSKPVGDGASRKLTVGPIERLVDEGNRSYTYVLDDTSPLLASYRSTLSVRDAGDGTSIVEWVGEFEPAEGATEEAATQVIEMIYETGLSGREKTLGQA